MERPDAGWSGSERAGVDPRAWVAVTLAYVVCVASFPKYALAPLAPLAVVPVLAAALSGIPPGVLLRRLALGAPFAVLVGIANPLLDPAPRVVVGGIAIAGGWISFGAIVLKFLLGAAMVVVLVHGVPFARTCRALRGLGVPRVLVAQIDILHRYLVVLAGEARSMWRARELRSHGSRRAVRLRVGAAMLAVLLRRSLDRGERVHRAMAQRGFDGEIRLLGTRSLRAADTAVVAAVVAFCAAARLMPVVDWLGEAVGV